MGDLAFEKKVERLRAVLPVVRDLVSPCRACGRRCGVNRLNGEVGACRADVGDGTQVRWQAALAHFGEEPMLVGRGGSGTVFFSFCTMRCVYCQNWQISHEGQGSTEDISTLAQTFLNLRKKGVENINLVTPTQYILPILSALEIAYAEGLDIPLVYNTNGYDSVELVQCLDGIVDIWLPDLKYMSHEPGQRYSGVGNYPETARNALRQMYTQVGSLQMKNGIAQRGVILRHLILPDDISGSFDLLLWLRDEGMTEITLSLMSQYSPQYRAIHYPEIARIITAKEYRDVVEFAEKLGFENILVQDVESRALFLPDFERERPFQEC